MTEIQKENYEKFRLFTNRRTLEESSRLLGTSTKSIGRYKKEKIIPEQIVIIIDLYNTVFKKNKVIQHLDMEISAMKQTVYKFKCSQEELFEICSEFS